MNTKLHRTTTSAHWAPYRRAAGVVLSTLLLVPSIATAAPPPPVGLKVILQPWDPRTDDDSVKTVLDSPDAISAGLSQTWAKSRTATIETLQKGLGKGDLIAKGVTLYDININLNEPELRVETGPGDTLKATLTMRDAYFEASATQPTILGSYADPRCSMRFTLDVTLPIRFNDTPSRLLQSAFGPNDRPLTVRDFRADSQNAVCYIAKVFLSTTGIWQQITNAVNDPNMPQYRQLNDALKRELDAALASVNSRIAVPAQFVRIRVWPNAAKSTVLFGVRELPVPYIRGGSVDGRVTVGDLKGLTLSMNRCDQLGFTAKVKTGPRPVLTPAGELGDPPTHNVDGVRMTGGVLAASGAAQAGQSCQYSLQGLVAGFPHFVSFNIAAQYRPSSSSLTPNVRNVVDVVPQGWRFTDALKLLPKADGRDLTLLAAMHGSPGYDARYDPIRPYNPGDPLHASIAASRVNPAVTATNPAAGAANPAAQAARAPASSIAASGISATSRPTSPSTPQWGGASLAQPTTPTAASQAVTRPASSPVTSGTFRAPTTAFIR